MHARLPVRVAPKSRSSVITGWQAGEVLVRLRSAPEGGKANQELCALIAQAVGVPKSSVQVVRGQTARHKEVRLEGISQEEVDAALRRPPAM